MICCYCNYNGSAIYTQAYNYKNINEAIIFLHGLGGNQTDGSFLNSDENKYMTITIDMPDHGRSGRLEKITWDTYVDAVKAVVDQYKINKVHFVGHSLGADTAMMYAYKYPEDVSDIILIDRAYYNFSEIEKYNFTPSFYKIVDIDPDSGLELKSANTFIDILYNNDITKTWNINKDVLLIAANPYWPLETNAASSIIDYIAAIKKSPAEYGITYSQASSLPDLTMDNIHSYMEFLKIKINDFKTQNKRFSVIKTPYEHDMIHNESAKPKLLKYTLDFINRNKHI